MTVDSTRHDRVASSTVRSLRVRGLMEGTTIQVDDTDGKTEINADLLCTWECRSPMLGVRGVSAQDEW